MIDARTAVLVGTAILSPYILDGAKAVGVPIPVYITGGQAAALAAFPATVLGVATTNPGTDIADTQSLVAKWNALNTAFLAQNGALVAKLYTNPKWNPTNYATLTPDQATELARAVLASADAGLNAATEPYDASLADSDAYTGLKGLLATNDTWGAADQSDADDMVPAIYELIVECDYQGYLPSGKPFTATVLGGIGAAGDAVKNFVEGVAGKAVGTAAGLAADALLSTPVLLLLAGLIVYKVVGKR